MKKSEQVTRIIKQLNETIVLKATAIKNQNFSEAGNLRYKERKLTERFRKLTGRLPEKDEKKVYIEKPLNPEVEQKHWNDLHATAHRQEEEKMKKSTGGVIIGLPVHLNPNNPVTAIDWDVPEKDRVYVVKNSRNSYRKFDGDHHRHCSKCPFEEGCVMCTLP
jgi:hypothetical protein